MADTTGSGLTENTVLSDEPQVTPSHDSCTRDVPDIDSADVEKSIALRSLGVPPALAEVLVEEDRQIGLRIFILDNSGSTASFDGHVFTRSEHNGQIIKTNTTRWEEIKHMAIEQAEWAMMMGTPCEFSLLNPGPPPLREGVDFAKINASGSSVDPRAQLSMLKGMLEKVRPYGATPIAERLDEVYTRIKIDHAELVSRGQRVVVVLATDGCPTMQGSRGQSTREDKLRVVQCIKKLTTDLPVFMVVRLTCDETDVIEFYNEIDAEVELNLEVLDDIENEAQELRDNGNGWLTYSPMIHRIREGGTFLKLFDILDERPLTAVEIVLLSKLLLSPENEDSVSFHAKFAAQGASQDSEKLLDMLDEYNKDAALVYNPLSRVPGKMTKPIDMWLVRLKVLPPLAHVKQAFFGMCSAIKALCPANSLADNATVTDPKVKESVRAVKFLECAAIKTMEAMQPEATLQHMLII